MKNYLKYKKWVPIAAIWLAVGLIYGLTMARSLGRADTFEFQVVAPQLGIAHPTGYPLYLLLGKLWTLLPWGSVAFRLNLGSVVFMLVAVSLLYRLTARVTGNKLAALSAAFFAAVLPTVWSQALEAEVYALHALLTLIALNLMAELLRSPDSDRSQRRLLWLAATLGLGMTNHVTTVLLLPAAIFIYIKSTISNKRSPKKLVTFGKYSAITSGAAQKLPTLETQSPKKLATFSKRSTKMSDVVRKLPTLIAAGLAPLILYAYLPLRWQAVNGEAMGWRRFFEWVVGGRFQDALQWGAWLRDGTRYAVVGRLFLDDWGWLGLALVAVGFGWLLWRRRSTAILLFLVWAAFTFYCLNYYVPDLRVFLIPAYMAMAVALGSAVAWLPGRGLAAAALAVFTLFLVAGRWEVMDRSAENPLLAWGEGHLARPLAPDAAILADSEKIAPLYYLQQAEGVRPDLDIMVLPDESAYRAVLAERLAAGDAVYLARYLPRLPYHLNAEGALTRVSTQALTPAPLPDPERDFGALQLTGVAFEPFSSVERDSAEITLHWQLNHPPDADLLIYRRWLDGEQPLPMLGGAHPVNNLYPVAAWTADETVVDFYTLPRPLVADPSKLAVQLAVGAAFVSAETLDWQTVIPAGSFATAGWSQDVLPAADIQPLHITFDDFTLSGTVFADAARAGSPLSVSLLGAISSQTDLIIGLLDENDAVVAQQTLAAAPTERWARSLTITLPPAGQYRLFAASDGADGRCGRWLGGRSPRCILGAIKVSGIPLPAGSTNFGNLLALTAVDLPQTQLQPSGTLAVTLSWLALAPIEDDYTVFLQIVDEHDTLIGQIDAWPLQGTHPTSGWRTGEEVEDPYLIPVSAEATPGNYRLLIGLYRLADLRRLPILASDDTPIDDKYTHNGLTLR